MTKHKPGGVLPQARSNEIVLQEAGTDLLLYDTKTNKAYCLNATIAKVWLECDGKTTVSQIASRQGLPEEIVLIGLERLSKEKLLTEDFGSPLLDNKISRRRLVAAATTIAIALPIISTLVAPTSASAQSVCLPNGQIFDAGPQRDATSCFNLLTEIQSTACCIGTFRTILFDNPVGTNNCRGICGPLSLVVQ